MIAKEMNDEKLIEFVRQYEELYNLAHPHYLNGNYKNKKWAEAAKMLGQPVDVCKTRWNNIRDNFRKSLKKRATKSGLSALRKYKYEDQLNFLVPFMKERDDKGNLSSAEKIIRDENDDDQFDDDNDDTKEGDQDRAKTSKLKYVEPVNNAENSNQNIDDDVTISNLSSSSSEFIKKERDESIKSKCKSASVINLMKYMLDRNEKISQQPIHPVDAFLAGLAPTLKSLSPYNLNIAKSKIFNIVQQIEMDQIIHMQQRCATLSSKSSLVPSAQSPSTSSYKPSVSDSTPAIPPTILTHTLPAESSNFNLNNKNSSS